jgi:hypothetical protein
MAVTQRKTAAAKKYAEDQKRNEEKIASGLVSERFPQVAGMVIKMTYYQEMANPVLMVRTVNVFPSTHAFFHMKCAIKECENGGFDLAPVIASMVRGRKKSAKGEMFCKGKGDKLKSKHASISYEIKIRYRSRSK